MRGLVTLIMTSLLLNQSVLAAPEGGRQFPSKQPKIPLPNERLGPDPHAQHTDVKTQKMEAVREDSGEEKFRRKGWKEEPKRKVAPLYNPNPMVD